MGQSNTHSPSIFPEKVKGLGLTGCGVYGSTPFFYIRDKSTQY